MSGRPDINTAEYRALAAQTDDSWLAETLTGFCDEIDDLRSRIPAGRCWPFRPHAWPGWSEPYKHTTHWVDSDYATTENRQDRTCARCGETRTRVIVPKAVL